MHLGGNRRWVPLQCSPRTPIRIPQHTNIVHQPPQQSAQVESLPSGCLLLEKLPLLHQDQLTREQES